MSLWPTSPGPIPKSSKVRGVVLVESSGGSVAEVARSLGISDRTLWNWVNNERKRLARASDPSTLSDEELAELKRLRKENAQQKIDMEILRKAAAYFARETMR